MHLDQECQLCQQWGSIRQPTPFGVTFPDILMGSQLPSTIHQWAFAFDFKFCHRGDLRFLYLNILQLTSYFSKTMKTSEFTSHSHTPEPGTPLPLNMQSFYGAVAKSPSPATNGYFSSGGSCGSSCAPRAETGNGAFGEGILRDSSGVPLVPASFFLQVGLSMEISAAKRAVNVAHWGP